MNSLVSAVRLVHRDGHERAEALAELGCTADELRDCLLTLERDYVERLPTRCPINSKGLTRWMVGTGAFRDLKCPQGWTAERFEGTEVTVRGDRRVSLVVATGDDGTGISSLAPRTNGDKNPRLFRVQSMQMSLLPDEASRRSAFGDVWVLLLRRAGPLLHAEVSLPAAIDESGRLYDWHRRILLDPIDIRKEERVVPPPTDEIDFDITPK